MPSEVFEDGENLSIGLLEAVPLGSGQEDAPSYPLPRLRRLDAEEMRTFRTVLLENPLLRVTVVPGLGGRILSVLDKRTDTEILRRYPSLLTVDGGPRGVELREGIQFEIDGPRRNALGNADTLLDHGADEDSPSGVWVSESIDASGISWHQHISLHPTRAEIQIEHRVFNRTGHPVPFDAALALHLGDGEWRGQAWFSPSRSCGFWVGTGERGLGRVTVDHGTLQLHRMPMAGSALAPRQLDSWTVRLVPFSEVANLAVATEEVAIGLSSSVVVQTASPRSGHKLVLLTEGGQTMEAPVDLYPERRLEILLPAPTRAVALLDEHGQEVARTDRVEGLRLTGDPTFQPTPRADAHVVLAEAALARRDFARAAAEFEQALTYNGEDHLAWWGRAVALRLLGDKGEERTELLNAHFLAPLDPVLRAESFLAMPVSAGKEPSPVVAPLADTPENLVLVASQLLEWRLYDQLQRWVDEALRHRDLPILRYLLAHAYLVGSRMEAEAAEQVRAGGAKGVLPPFPCRPVEWEAVAALLARFPEDRALGTVAALARLRPTNG